MLALVDVVRARLPIFAPAGVWTAATLVGEGLRLPKRENVELRGSVTQVRTTQSFAVDGVSKDASNAVFPDGSRGVTLGARVKVVEGSSTDGVLIARGSSSKAKTRAGARTSSSKAASAT